MRSHIKNSCFGFHQGVQTPRNNKSTRPKRPRAFICFSVFGTPDETFALVVDILRQDSNKYNKTPTYTSWLYTFKKYLGDHLDHSLTEEPVVQSRTQGQWVRDCTYYMKLSSSAGSNIVCSEKKITQGVKSARNKYGGWFSKFVFSEFEFVASKLERRSPDILSASCLYSNEWRSASRAKPIRQKPELTSAIISALWLKWYQILSSFLVNHCENNPSDKKGVDRPNTTPNSCHFVCRLISQSFDWFCSLKICYGHRMVWRRDGKQNEKRKRKRNETANKMTWVRSRVWPINPIFITVIDCSGRPRSNLCIESHLFSTQQTSKRSKTYYVFLKCANRINGTPHS